MGQQGKSFSGIFDGDGNTLTYNRGSVTSQHTEYVDDYCAPFSLLEGPTIKNSSFTGSFQGTATCSGGMVGYTSMPVTFSHCLFAPERTAYADGCATYIRTPENIVCPMEDCYYTTAFGLSQGQPVFREVEVPEGCTYQMVSEANVRFNGVDYYTNGTQIVLTAPDGMNFGFWSAEGSCFVSDPWTKNGVHELRDVRRMPSFTIATKMPNAKQERTIEGTKYRYLSESD